MSERLREKFSFFASPFNTAFLRVSYEKFMKKRPLTYFYSIRKVHKDLITREEKFSIANDSFLDMRCRGRANDGGKSSKLR